MPHTITIKERRGRPGHVYYPLQLSLVSKTTPGPKQLLVKIEAAALNHRDLFIRQNLYSDISFKAPLLYDNAGVVVEEGATCTSSLLAKRVILTPCRGWQESLSGPESWSNFNTIGGVGPDHTIGTAQTYAVDEEEVEAAPNHLTAVESPDSSHLERLNPQDRVDLGRWHIPSSKTDKSCFLALLTEGTVDIYQSNQTWIVDPRNIDKLMPVGSIGELPIEMTQSSEGL